VTSSSITWGDLDVADSAFRADPYPFYAALRERAPVVPLPGTAIRVVSGYDEVRTLLRDPRTNAHTLVEPASGPESGHGFLNRRMEIIRLFSLFMHHRSAADHQRLRRLALPSFSPSRMASRRAQIQELTDDAIERGLTRGRLDVIEDLGLPIAVTSIMDLLGIPEPRRPAFGEWARELVYEVDVGPGQVARERSILAMAAMTPALRELLAEWRRHPPADDNLLWTMERARQSGTLTEDEVVSQAALLIFSGYATSQHLIGNGVLALMRHPDQWELLASRPELIETAVEEFVRFDSPTTVLRRWASDDIEIAGQTIPRDAELLLVLGAANRDSAVFADPDRLDITRSPNPHLGFGHDAHYCLGAALGRLNAQVAIGSLTGRVRLPRLESEDLEWTDTLVIRGLESLPILLEAR
jgi:pimeloyl-[acyl-carrier protein] synthase